MAYTVRGAFDAFRKNTIDLDPDQTKRARASRDYLCDQITALGRRESSLPSLLNKYMPFGSFARRSKVRPLDDIDFLMFINGSGTSVHPSQSNHHDIWLRIEDSSASLSSFPDDYGYINSTKVLNKIRSSVASVPNYFKADTKRTGEAVTLNLISYTWVFDIVPTIPVYNSLGTLIYYLIPNGRGDWKKTDPRSDSENVTRVNTQHSGQFLPTLRLLKYWNDRTYNKPRLGSYYFENLALKVFDYAPTIADFPKAIDYFLRNLPSYVYSTLPDPKNLGPDLDAGVDWSTKTKVAQAASNAQTDARMALYYESRSEHREAIGYWRRIFGSEFPNYG